MEPADDIRVFLESPFSLDPVDPAVFKSSDYGIECCSEKKLKKKKRKVKLPPYIPYKSVYEQTDLTKLTERQRRMVLKFRENRERVSNLFLEVHGIYLQTPASIERSMNREKEIKTRPAKTRVFRKKNISDETYINTAIDCAKADDGMNGDFRSCTDEDTCELHTGHSGCKEFTEPARAPNDAKLEINVRLPFLVLLTCDCCKEDAIGLLHYLNWIISTRDGEESRVAAEFRSVIASLIGRYSCICVYEPEIYEIALEIAESG